VFHWHDQLTIAHKAVGNEAADSTHDYVHRSDFPTREEFVSDGLGGS
jgi:hypothetical protein